MSTFDDNPVLAGMAEIRKSWGWFMFLGIALTILGMVCITFSASATSATVLVFGWLLLISGVFGLIHSFFTGTWNGFFLYLLGALLRGITGYLLVRYPITGAASITLVLASFFIVGGMFRAIGSGMAKFPNWGWAVFSGLISVVLGVMLLGQWPVSSLWFVGFAIGVDLVFDGVALASFATAIHSSPRGMIYKTA